jgi:hypothetical protein
VWHLRDLAAGWPDARGDDHASGAVVRSSEYCHDH